MMVEPQTHREKCLWLAAIFEKPRVYIDERRRRTIVPAMALDLFIAQALRVYADQQQEAGGWARGYAACREAQRTELEWQRAEIERLRADNQMLRNFMKGVLDNATMALADYTSEQQESIAGAAQRLGGTEQKIATEQSEGKT